MKLKSLEPKVFAGYGLAVLVYAFAIYLQGLLGAVVASNLVTLLATSSLVLVSAATFRWGQLSGFPVMSEGKGFSFEYLLRNLVMSALVIIMLSILAAPVWVAAAKLASYP